MIILMLVSYFMDGNRLQVISEERDLGLGVITSEDLKWFSFHMVIMKVLRVNFFLKHSELMYVAYVLFVVSEI